MDKVPSDLLESIFTYVDAETLFMCTKVCKRWSEVLEPGDSKVWKCRFRAMELDHDNFYDFTTSPLLDVLPTAKAKVRAYLCAWSEDDCSETIYIKDDFITLHRNPVAKSTDSLRTKAGFRYGRHYFVITFHGPDFGSHAMVGVCTKDAPLRIRSYDSLLGLNPHAWGWDLVNNVLRHNNEQSGNQIKEKAEIDKSKIGVLLDIEQGTLEFTLDGVKIPEKFTNIPKDHEKEFYPTISAVYGNCEISLLYYGKPPL